MNTPLTHVADVGGTAQPLLMVKNLIKHFALKKDILGKGGGVVRAVDGIDFMVRKGETLGGRRGVRLRQVDHRASADESDHCRSRRYYF